MGNLFSRNITAFYILFALLTALAAAPPGASAAADADRVIQKSNMAYYYAGRDGRARVKMTIKDRAGRTRVRELTMLRYDVKDGGRQKFYVYFHRPVDVEGMVFMVWKNPKGDDDRWLYIPAIDLVKRIAAKDKRSSFAGSNFTYEDVSGRSPALDAHELLGEEDLEGRPVFVIKNSPGDGDLVEFSYYKVWIDKENFLPLKAEYFDKGGRLYKTMTSLKIKDIQGIPTVTKAKAAMSDGGQTIIEFEDVKYNVGLKENIFTERFLRRPPRRWVK